jgi:hypothetical protein
MKRTTTVAEVLVSAALVLLSGQRCIAADAGSDLTSVRLATLSVAHAAGRKSVTVAGVTASVSLRQVANDEFQIVVDFESATYPVACLGPYRDLHFTLRDAQGGIVPIDMQTLQHPPLEGYGTFNHVQSSNAGKAYSCANANVRKQSSWVRFSRLYPNLKQGTYTLTVTFAPSGSSLQRSFAPFTVVVS